MRKRSGVVAAAVAVAVAGSATAVLADIAPIETYADSLVKQYETTKVISTGDTVPETSDPSKDYQMVGIPDGLGAHQGPKGTRIVYMNHELPFGSRSEPVLGEPLNRGAIVSRLVLDRDGKVLSGERAYDTVYIDDTLVGPAADGRQPDACSSRASARGPWPARTRASTARSTSPTRRRAPRRTRSTARAACPSRSSTTRPHALTDLGRFAWENTLVQPGSGERTVIMGMEDGPADLDRAVENSQLYLYVGEKDRSPGATVLERNGLVGGKLYVFAARNAAIASEAQFHEGTINGKWVEIPGADAMDETRARRRERRGGRARLRPPRGRRLQHPQQEPVPVRHDRRRARTRTSSAGSTASTSTRRTRPRLPS